MYGQIKHISIYFRQTREADEEATTAKAVTESEATEENKMDVVAAPELDAVEEDESDDDTEEVENETADNMDRCHKCLKQSYQFKKEFYCAKCVREGVVKLSQDKPVKCKKCRKGNYRAKNKDFCSAECPVESAMELMETTEEVEKEAAAATLAPVEDLGFVGNLVKLLVHGSTWGSWSPPHAAPAVTEEASLEGAF